MGSFNTQAESRRQHFSQPVVGYFDPSVLIAPDTQAATHVVDFETIAPEDLGQIDVPFRFTASPSRPGTTRTAHLLLRA